MLYNYHTHTKRCNHAKGEDRDFIEAAIAAGIKTLGFADHSPMDYGGDLIPDRDLGHRVPMSLAEDYCRSILELREEYRDRIEIHLGVEIENYPKYFDRTYDYLRSLGVEYFILGQHFTKNGNDEGVAFAAAATEDKQVMLDYVDAVVEMIESERCMYVCHPDVINYHGDEKFREKQLRRICEAAVKHNTPLEVNLLGIMAHRFYPSEDFWKIAGECGAKAIVGCDIHIPANFARVEEAYLKAEEFLKPLGVNVSRETYVDFEKTCKRLL